MAMQYMIVIKANLVSYGLAITLAQDEEVILVDKGFRNLLALLSNLRADPRTKTAQDNKTNEQTRWISKSAMGRLGFRPQCNRNYLKRSTFQQICCAGVGK